MSNDGHPLLVLLVCLLKSFKELFIYQTLTKGHPLLSREPLFSEASAKVRTFSEPRKSFREKFSKIMHFPAVVDGGQGHIRHTHYYILYRRRGNGAGGTEGWRWEGGRCRGGLWLGWGQHTEECIWRGHGAGMAGEKAINKTINTQSLFDNY